MELLKKLTMCFAPSGREENIRELIKSEAEKYADEIYEDTLGNLIAKKGGCGKKIVILSHMDEIGVVVTYKDEKGFLRFAPVGGLKTKDLVGRRVQFENGAIGVIGVHDDTDKYDVSKMFIDASGNDDISVGDMAVFTGEFYENDTHVISKALDNRVGCYVALKALQSVETSNELYFIFTVQEEVGLRGAKTATYGIDADFAVAVDVTAVGDTPGAKEMNVKLGCGAAIKVMDRSVICHSQVRDALIDTASKSNIPYQLEILTAGGTDAGAVHISGSGIKTGAISIPTRYIHSPSEMIDKQDLKACTELLKEYIK